MATSLKRVVFYARPDVVDFLDRSTVAQQGSSVSEIIRRAIRMAEYAEHHPKVRYDEIGHH